MAQSYFSSIQSASQRRANPKTKLGAVGIIAAVILIVVLGGGAYTSRRVAWLFTPAGKPRSVTNKFLADALAGKPQDAYAITSEHMQQLNSYNAFSSTIAPLKNPNAEIKPVVYKVKANKDVVIVGTLVDKHTKEVNIFGATISNNSSKDPKIDALTVVNAGTKTASTQSQILNKLASSL